MCSLDVIESSNKLLQEGMLCAHLNDGRKIKSRSLIKNHLLYFFPEWPVFSVQITSRGKKDLSCWIRALLYYTCNADASKSQIVLASSESKNFQDRLPYLLCFQLSQKFHLELYFTGLQFQIENNLFKNFNNTVLPIWKLLKR